MENLTLKNIFQRIYRKKLMICMIISIFAVLGAIYTFKIVKPTYESFTTFLLTKSSIPRKNISNFEEERELVDSSSYFGSVTGETITQEDNFPSRNPNVNTRPPTSSK